MDISKQYGNPVSVACKTSDAVRLKYIFSETAHVDSAFLDEFSEINVYHHHMNGVLENDYNLEFSEFGSSKSYYELKIDSLKQQEIVNRQMALSDDYRELRKYMFSELSAYEIGGLSVVLRGLNRLNPGVEFDTTKTIWQTLELATRETESGNNGIYQLAIALAFKVSEDSGLLQPDEKRQELFKKSFGSKNK